MDYRIEQKFLCNPKDYHIIKSRISDMMTLDQNANTNGTYQIRSVYFDDMYQSKYHENEQGCDERFKYRIRTYDCNKNLIRLEKKSKKNTYTNKQSCLLTPEEYQMFMDGNFTFTPSSVALKNEFALSILLYGTAPSAIIDYHREAYVYPAGNVRVTFDGAISTSTDYDHFFSTDMFSLPILPSQEMILEVKYDEFIPKPIATMLELRTLQQITFSKFYLGKQKILTHDGGFNNGI